MVSKLHPICPRCCSKTTKVHATSPDTGVWTMFGCDTCFYTWRSTEPAANTDPDRYPAVFKLSPDIIPTLPVVPVIPPRRAKS